MKGSRSIRRKGKRPKSKRTTNRPKSKRPKSKRSTNRPTKRPKSKRSKSKRSKRYRRTRRKFKKQLGGSLMLRLPQSLGGLPPENIKIIHTQKRGWSQVTDEDYNQFNNQIANNYHEKGLPFGQDIYPKVYMLFCFIGGGLIFHPIILVTHASVTDEYGPELTVRIEKAAGEKQFVNWPDQIVGIRQADGSVAEFHRQVWFTVPEGSEIGEPYTMGNPFRYPVASSLATPRGTIYSRISEHNMAHQLCANSGDSSATVHPHAASEVQSNTNAYGMGNINVRAMVYIGHFNEPIGEPDTTTEVNFPVGAPESLTLLRERGGEVRAQDRAGQGQNPDVPENARLVAIETAGPPPDGATASWRRGVGERAGGITHAEVTEIFAETRRDRTDLTLTFSVASDEGGGGAMMAPIESDHSRWIKALRNKKEDGEPGDFINGKEYNLATNNCQTYAQGALNYLKGLGPGVFTAAPWKSGTC